jgi:hypothetical protein
LLSRVFASRLAAGVYLGLLAAAATAGVLVGFGLRHGSSLDPFHVYGRAALGAATGRVASRDLAILAGFLAHTLWMLLWGVCFSVVATPLRGSRTALAALAYAALLGVLSVSIVPGALGAASLATLSAAQRVFLVLVVAGTLTAGMRLAPRHG